MSEARDLWNVLSSNHFPLEDSENSPAAMGTTFVSSHLTPSSKSVLTGSTKQPLQSHGNTRQFQSVRLDSRQHKPPFLASQPCQDLSSSQANDDHERTFETQEANEAFTAHCTDLRQQIQELKKQCELQQELLNFQDEQIQQLTSLKPVLETQNQAKSSAIAQLQKQISEQAKLLNKIVLSTSDGTSTDVIPVVNGVDMATEYHPSSSTDHLQSYLHPQRASSLSQPQLHAALSSTPSVPSYPASTIAPSITPSNTSSASPQSRVLPVSPASPAPRPRAFLAFSEPRHAAGSRLPVPVPAENQRYYHSGQYQLFSPTIARSIDATVGCANRMINFDEFGTGTVTAKKAEATSSAVYAIPDEERARQRAAEGLSAESEDIEEDVEDEVADSDVPSLDR